MHKSVVTMCLMLFLAACASVSAPAPAQDAADLSDDRELIVLTLPPERPLIEQAAVLGYTLKDVHALDQLDEVLVVFEIPDDRTIPEAIKEIEEESPGVTAGAHHLYRLQQQQQEAAIESHTYASALIGWPIEGCPALRLIGMIDSGVLPDHPGLADGRIVERRFVAGETGRTGDHGALLAEALIGPGGLKGTTLYSADVFDRTPGNGTAAGVVSILRAIDWLDSKGVDLVNISLAGPRNKLLDRGLGKAAAQGTVIVAAAGNLGPSASPQFPAAFPFVLAVTAIDRDGNVYDRAVRGAHIDVAAPGVDILIPQEDRLRIMSGTSVAAPFVTAVIAADENMRGLDVEAARARLASFAVDLGSPGKDPVFGAGLVRAPENCRASPA